MVKLQAADVKVSGLFSWDSVDDRFSVRELKCISHVIGIIEIYVRAGPTKLSSSFGTGIDCIIRYIWFAGDTSFVGELWSQSECQSIM